MSSQVQLTDEEKIAAERADPKHQVGAGAYHKEHSAWNLDDRAFRRKVGRADMRRLALAVIAQAQKDLQAADASVMMRIEAMMFLIAPDPWQRQWYDWAQVSASAVRKATVAQFGEVVCRKMSESASVKSLRMSSAHASTTGGRLTPGGLSQPEKVANSPSEVLFISGLPSTSATQSEAWTPHESTWKRGVKSSSSPNHSEPSILPSRQRWPTTS